MIKPTINPAIVADMRGRPRTRILKQAMMQELHTGRTRPV